MMKLNEYDQQAADFCEKFGIAITVTPYPTELQTAPKWVEVEKVKGQFKHGLRYRIIITSPGNEGLAFDYWGSIAAREEAWKKHSMVGPKKPRPYDILSCLASDSHCDESFEDFCGNMGFDTDSIKGKKTWKRCRKFAREIVAFFGGDGELEALREIQ